MLCRQLCDILVLSHKHPPITLILLILRQGQEIVDSVSTYCGLGFVVMAMCSHNMRPLLTCTIHWVCLDICQQTLQVPSQNQTLCGHKRKVFGMHVDWKGCWLKGIWKEASCGQARQNKCLHSGHYHQEFQLHLHIIARFEAVGKTLLSDHLV